MENKEYQEVCRDSGYLRRLRLSGRPYEEQLSNKAGEVKRAS